MACRMARKSVETAAQPRLRNGQRQAGDRNREEQDQGEEIHRERLHRACALVAHAAPQRKRDAAEHQHGRNIQAVKEQPRGEGVQPEADRREAEQVRHVGHLVVRSAGEVNPAEDQREGDGIAPAGSPRTGI